MQKLIADGCTRSDIHMALDRTKSPQPASSVEWASAYEGANLSETLADPGRPMTRPTWRGPSQRCPRGGRE